MSFGLAETAKLAVDLSLTGNFASGVSGSQRALTGFATATNKITTATSKLSGALGHAKHSIGDLLTGPLGVLGLAGGIGGIGVAFEKVISHTNDFAFSVEKLTELTGGSAEAMSTLLAVFEKFNIDAERTGMIVGFAEKTLGHLAKTTVIAGKTSGDLAKAQEAVTRAHERLILAEGRAGQTAKTGNLTTSARIRLQEQLTVAEQHYAEIRASKTAKLSTIESARNRVLDLQRKLEGGAGASSLQLTSSRFAVRDATAALTAAEQNLASVRASQGATSTSALIALDQAYGLHLIDTKGKLVDFNEELKQVADVYTSNIDPARKAALAAQLFGRGYADLVPILSLGRKGIDDAAQAAKDLGLTLTAQNARDLKDYRESLRETGDAIGGLELQIGLALVPAIKDMADAITRFLRNGGRDQLVKFFKTVIVDAREFAGFVTGTVVPVFATLAGAAKTAIAAIPPWLRDLLIKGFVANKAVKFVFGIDVAGSFAGVLKKAVTGSLIKSLAETGLGKAFVQPVFVTNPGFGLPGVGAAGAEGAAAGETGLGLLARFGLTAGVLGGLTVGVMAAVGLGSLLDDALRRKGQTFDQASAGQAQTPGSSGAVLFTGAVQYDSSMPAGKTVVHAGKGGTLTIIGTGPVSPLSIDPNAGAFDTRSEAAGVRNSAAVWAGPSRDIAEFAHTGTRDIAEFVDNSKGIFSKLAMTVADKFNVKSALSYMLAGIKKRSMAHYGYKVPKSWVEGTFGRDLLRYAGNILRSHQSATAKIVGIEHLERLAVANKDWGVARKLKAEIEAAKRAQTAAQAKTTKAVKDKNLAVTLYNTNTAYFNGRLVNSNLTRYQSTHAQGRIAT